MGNLLRFFDIFIKKRDTENSKTDIVAILKRVPLFSTLNKKELKKLLQEYEKGRNELKKMNNTYLRAKDGHKKFGTEEDLGYNSYGPVFIRINYPNAQDKKNYEKAKKENKIPKENGNFKSIGTGIAIHGTNDENSIGHNASSGCVRMRNEDIEDLLFYIEPKLKVIIKGGKDE